MHTLTLGDVSISRIVEIGRSSFPTAQMLPESDAGKIASHHRWIKPHFFDDVTGDLGSRIQTWIVRTPRHTVLVDTGVGNDKDRGDNALWNRRSGGFLDDLAAAGVTPEQVDLVLCTHLHVDHVGWNTRLVDGRWVPTFPRARYLFGRTEYEHWRDHSETPDKVAVFNDSVKPIVDAGKAELIASDAKVCEEITVIPTPGHSPGHMSIHIQSDGEEGLLTGDVAHHPCQMAHLNWSSTADSDPVRSAATRRELFSRFADRPVLVIGGHYNAGHIRRDGDAFKFIAWA